MELQANKQVNADMILNCEVKDETGLNDFQKLPSSDEVAIPFVGINRFRSPLIFNHPEGQRTHDCHVSLGINMRSGKTGINMSRLCKIINFMSENGAISFWSLRDFLAQARVDLRDNSEIDDIDRAQIEIDFNYGLKQKSLASDNWGWQYYKSKITCIEDQGEFKAFLTVHYEYSSTCPCSLSMAKQYERDFAAGLITQGNGVATAHSQRSEIVCKVELTKNAIENNFFVEDLVKILRLAVPTETQSFVKRLDEQAFAILNGSNPMFVEHVSKRIFRALNTITEIIADWKVDIEHWESLHSHNATASIYKGIPKGLR